jgi:uncharacterized protein (TIGR02996 family)
MGYPFQIPVPKRGPERMDDWAWEQILNLRRAVRPSDRPFIRAIMARPEDPLMRRIYADFLDDSGEILVGAFLRREFVSGRDMPPVIGLWSVVMGKVRRVIDVTHYQRNRAMVRRGNNRRLIDLNWCVSLSRM